MYVQDGNQSSECSGLGLGNGMSRGDLSVSRALALPFLEHKWLYHRVQLFKRHLEFGCLLYLQLESLL